MSKAERQETVPGIYRGMHAISWNMDEWETNECKYILSLLNPSKGKIINTQFSHRLKFMKELVFKLGGQDTLRKINTGNLNGATTNSFNSKFKLDQE